jgi:hypothetical protein
VKLTHTPLIENSDQYKQAFAILPGKMGATLTDIDQTLSAMHGELRDQALNWMLNMAFHWQRSDVLDYVLSQGVTDQPGFFHDLAGALELYGRLQHADLENPSLPGFIALLQDYSATLGDEFTHEATALLLPRSERALTIDNDYRLDFEHHLDLFRMVFGSNAFLNPEVGNLLLSNIRQSPSYRCRYGVAFKTLEEYVGQDFAFDDDIVMAGLLNEKVYHSASFFSSHAKTIADHLSRMERPSTQNKLLVNLIKSIGHAVLPVLASGERFRLGSSGMSQLNRYILHGESRGDASLKSHREIHESLSRRVLTHPSFDSQATVDSSLRDVTPSVYSALSVIVAGQVGVKMQIAVSSLSEFCSAIEKEKHFTAADMQALNNFLRDQVVFDIKKALRGAKKHLGENPIISMMENLDNDSLIDACLIQVCYEQTLKEHAKGIVPAAETPLLNAARRNVKNPDGNPHYPLAKTVRHLMEVIDDERIIAHLPKNKRFIQTMIRHGLIKDRKYISLLTPKQREEILCKDLGL